MSRWANGQEGKPRKKILNVLKNHLHTGIIFIQKLPRLHRHDLADFVKCVGCRPSVFCKGGTLWWGSASHSPQARLHLLLPSDGLQAGHASHASDCWSQCLHGCP